MVCAANKRAVKFVTSGVDFPGFDELLWPVLAPKCRRTCKVLWRKAWSCQTCCHFFTHVSPKSIRSRRCCRVPARKGTHAARRRRFFKVARLLRRGPHGLPEEVLNSRLAAAEAALISRLFAAKPLKHS